MTTSTTAATTKYTRKFFNTDVAAWVSSADAALPLVFELTGVPSSVGDFGCGVGYWLRAAMDLGITDVRGFDGDYVERSQLCIPPERFTAVDLTKPVDPGRRFDLALCLEVGEHLPRSAAATLVGTLTRASDIILFSAAIPLQGGVDHINEQWPAYWAELFANHGYEAVDVVRRRIWNDERIRAHYKQNLILYVQRDRLHSMPELHASWESNGPHALPLVHPKVYFWRAEYMTRPKSAREILGEVKRSLRSVLRRSDSVRGA